MRRAPLRSLLNVWTALLIVALLANAVAFSVWTLPRWNARPGASGGTAEIDEARQRIEPSLRAARDSYGRLVRAENDLEAFRAQLVTTVAGSDLMSMLVRAGDNTGITVDDARFQLAPVDELGVVQLGINLPVAGHYEAVRGLLDELVALPMFLVIDGIGLQIASGSGATMPGGPNVGETVLVDLAISVFVDDPELAAAAVDPGPAVAGAPRVTSRTAAQEARLLAAAQGDDPEELVEALVARLASLPPLPVDPEDLVLRLDRLDRQIVAAESQRDLFSVVLPPAPTSSAQPELQESLEPEPPLPVQLLGVMSVEGRWHASLRDGVDLFVVEAGDSLPSGVEILEVGTDYVDVLIDGERSRLTLKGTQP